MTGLLEWFNHDGSSILGSADILCNQVSHSFYRRVISRVMKYNVKAAFDRLKQSMEFFPYLRSCSLLGYFLCDNNNVEIYSHSTLSTAV
jgi:hypothetical protein